VSRPFARPASGKIAMKVINHYGDEVLKVFETFKTLGVTPSHGLSTPRWAAYALAWSSKRLRGSPMPSRNRALFERPRGRGEHWLAFVNQNGSPGSCSVRGLSAARREPR